MSAPSDDPGTGPPHSGGKGKGLNPRLDERGTLQMHRTDSSEQAWANIQELMRLYKSQLDQKNAARAEIQRLQNELAGARTRYGDAPEQDLHREPVTPVRIYLIW